MMTDEELKEAAELDKRVKWLGARILKLESDLDVHRINRDNCRKMLEAYPNDKCAAAIVDEEEGQIKVKCFELVDLRKEYYKKIIRVTDFVRNRVWDCE